MSDSYIKDIVYDLINSKLRIKELEDKIVQVELEMAKLTSINTELTLEVNKWKTQMVSYITDYREAYNTSCDIKYEICSDIQDVNINDNNLEENIIVESTNIEYDSKKTRKEYMKDYMKNKRKKEKEELKNIIINKK